MSGSIWVFCMPGIIGSQNPSAVQICWHCCLDQRLPIKLLSIFAKFCRSSFCQVLPIKLLPSFVNWQQCFSSNPLAVAATFHQLKKSPAATLADAEVAIMSVADAIILVSEYPRLSFLVFSNCRAPDTKLGPIDYLVWMDQINGLFLFMVIVMKLVGINSPVAMTKVTHDSNTEIRPRKTPFKTLLKLRCNLVFFKCYSK